MRGTAYRALSCTVLATVVAVGAAGATPAPPAARASSAALPQEVRGGVVVELPEGDRFKVWHSRDLRTVWGQRYDAATSTWGGRTVVLQEADLFCGAVDARSSAGAVAVIAACNEGGYPESDSEPQDVRALYSPDTVSWTAHDLSWEGHEEPGISPDGRWAVWPLHQGYVTWTASEGFVRRQVDAPGQEYTVTATVADDGTVSFLYGGNAEGRGSECRIHVVTQRGSGPPARESLVVPSACSVEHDLVNLDALTVHFDFYGSPPHLTTIGRPDTSSAWAVTSLAPAHAPGLRRHEGRTRTTFLYPPGSPLVALGSADRRVFEMQTYDDVARRWGPPRRVARLDGPCRWDPGVHSPRLAVLVAEERRDGRQRALVSTDVRTWYDVPLRRPLGFSADGQQVSASSRRSTTVFSRTEGRVRIPLGASRPCDAVLPSSATSVVRLTTSRDSGWPTVLQRSTPGGWTRTATAMPRVPTGADSCSRVRTYVDDDGLPRYWFSGRLRGVTLTVVPRGDGWKVRRTRD